jgi:hypothetical protein
LRKEVGEEVRREIGDERRGEFGGELHDENLCWCAIGKDKGEWVLEELLSASCERGLGRMRYAFDGSRGSE